MRMLVTGANGLIGSSIVHELLHSGIEVRSFVRDSSNLSLIRNADTEIAKGDVLDVETLRRAAGGCAVIMHTVADFRYSDASLEQMFEKARVGVENIFKAAKSAGVERIVLTSSSVVFGYSNEGVVISENRKGDRGSSQYELMKVEQDHHATVTAKECKIELVRVCPTMTVGPYVSSIGPSNAIIASYLNNPLNLSYPGGCNIVSSTDIGKAHLCAALYGKDGEAYIAGSQNMTWKEIHSIIAELCGLPSPILMLNRTNFLQGTLVELAKSFLKQEEPKVTLEQAEMIGRFYWYSSQKISEIGYKPESARSALTKAISHLVKQSDISRETRCRIRLHHEVQELRRSMR